jgi:geranylgeranylglycerol-phosphate geranylgeranyltransferase
MPVYLELLRPFTLIAPIVGVFAGAIIASRNMPNILVLTGAFSAAMLNAASNVANQYFDLEIDRINKPSRPLPSGRIRKKRALIFAFLIYFIALILSWLVNQQFFLIVFTTAIVTFFYSAPPLRLKRFPFISNIYIAIPRGMFLIVSGWSIVRSIWTVEPWFIGLIFTLYLMGASVTKDFSDVKGDRRFSIRTLPVIYGPEKSARIISPFFYLPFILIPLGVATKIILPQTLPLTCLGIWGFYTAKLILLRPQDLTIEQNHISWKHMYFTLIAGQLGFALAYIIKI